MLPVGVASPAHTPIFDLLGGGSLEPLLPKQLFSFPLALIGYKLDEPCHVLCGEGIPCSTHFRTVRQRLTTNVGHAQGLYEPWPQELGEVLACFALQNSAQQVGARRIVHEFRTRLIHEGMGKKSTDPVRIVDPHVGDFAFMAAAHHQKMTHRGFFQIFAGVLRNLFREDIHQAVVQAEQAFLFGKTDGSGGQALAEGEHDVGRGRRIGLPPALRTDFAMAQQHEAVHFTHSGKARRRNSRIDLEEIPTLSGVTRSKSIFSTQPFIIQRTPTLR